MIHENERAGHLDLEFHNRHSAGGDQRRLDVVIDQRGTALMPDAVKNFADDVK